MTTFKLGYAIDQWKPQFDDFVRRRDHERALKTIAIAGFSGVQLTSGTGRWQPLGNPRQLAANFGSVDGFGEFVRSCALDAVAAFVVDPGQGFHEDLSHGADARRPADRDAVVAKCRWFAEAVALTGGDVLVCRPAPSGAAGKADDAAIAALAECWNAAGQATAELGVTTTVRFDFLSCLRLADGWDRLLAALDPALVGLALDTGELAAAGRDPLAEIERSPLPLRHVILSNALAGDGLGEFTRPGAEFTLRQSGGQRRIPRWFGELEEPGLVDPAAVLAALGRLGYGGWIVVNTAPSPHPATSALLSGYHLHQILLPALTRRSW
ncbi:sugar phosphate isomerase/epimerase family protein [Nonomuraea sp. NPDC049269]|uniref:sugar phosphate isomerase/epimerase family protein n=1 Tax=Nonomuraea sp. NPDC049269 TaxID=3364349 RepID=UPI00371E31F8